MWPLEVGSHVQASLIMFTMVAGARHQRGWVSLGLPKLCAWCPARFLSVWT